MKKKKKLYTDLARDLKGILNNPESDFSEADLRMLNIIKKETGIKLEGIIYKTLITIPGESCDGFGKEGESVRVPDNQLPILKKDKIAQELIAIINNEYEIINSYDDPAEIPSTALIRRFNSKEKQSILEIALLRKRLNSPTIKSWISTSKLEKEWKQIDRQLAQATCDLNLTIGLLKKYLEKYGAKFTNASDCD